MRSILALAVLAAAPLAAPMSAHAADAPPAAAAPAKYSTAETPIGTLIDDPAAKAVLDKYLPGLSSNPQMAQARGLTLRAIQPYAAEMLTDAKLNDIDYDLGKLPAKK